MRNGNILPTPIEIVREIAGCLGLRNTKETKYLDDKADNAVIHPEHLKAVVCNVLYERLSDYGSERLARFVTDYVISITDTYCKKLAGCSFFIGSTRQQVLLTLNRHFFSIQLETVLGHILKPYQRFNGPRIRELLCTESAFDVVWLWCTNNIDLWQMFDRSTKEDKDKIRNWRAGKHLPSISTLTLLLQSKLPVKLCVFLYPLFLTAQFIDALRQKSWGRRLLVGTINLSLPNRTNNELQQSVNSHTNRYFSRFSFFVNQLSTLEKILNRRNKSIFDLKEASVLLLAFKSMEPTKIPLQGKGLVLWLEAKFLVQTGKLASAVALYEKAFSALLGCGGNYIDTLINEALVVASKAEKCDAVFLKKLKTAQILYGYDIQSVAINHTHSSQQPARMLQLRSEDTIEPWEIDMWSKSFDEVFAPHMLFQGVSYSLSSQRGPLFIDIEHDIRPDLRYPNKKISIGKTWQRRMPQLNYFIMVNCYDAVCALVEHGADVNVCSEVGDTPLLLSLTKMDLLESAGKFDKRFFDLIVSKPVTADIVRMRTQKKRLLPLIQAVRTGQLEIVKTLLELGADVHQRGLTDHQTALNDVIKLIGVFKNPAGFKQVMMQHPMTPELLDAHRRHSAGDIGWTLDGVESAISTNQQDPRRKVFFDDYFDAVIKRLHENTSLTELRQIATLLIIQGSNVNAEHKSPIKGYTPLMLAAELNEGELFALMLQHKGIPSKTYVDPNTQTLQNAWQVAGYWRAHSVLMLRH